MAKSATLTLDLLKENFVICRLSPSSSLPSWAFTGPFYSITKTNDELSIITMDNNQLPKDIQCERNWKCFKLLGPFPFDITGVLTSVLNPLAKADVGILAISTFDTDYVMVKDNNLQVAIDVLKQHGHTINV
ncbi:unnamed protein product [Rotaria magnacalcarata]|uniref:Aspartate kinase n=2 Tax=Rotaria magnacalcarata TaxID=392030 RepID=A0A816URU2_9BILA|nr:unnamed protein product [Rotaria magnacalcarata]CAF1553513.1 unnamed protein product [Rotaria magnacalcarata]CAF1973583.1 unnamed protein product [Rotaria magnacalcarata]CAF2092349.1 unnamed protein product [Rotaria magnacalcarata]CAF2117058.1 unnamed protein product [Rotaria magnacalcarata]